MRPTALLSRRQRAGSCGAALAAALFVLGPIADRAVAADLAVPADFATIQAAISAAAPGDRVVVAPGSYAESLDFAGKDVLVESAQGSDVTVLDAGGARAVAIGPGGGLSGFTITNAAYAAGGALLVRGVGTRLEANVFDGSLPAASGTIVVTGIAASPDIEANRFRNYVCSDSQSSGVLVFTGGSSPRIVNNVFEDNDCAALNMISAYGAVPLVMNNTFVRNRIGIRVDRSRDAILEVYRNNLVFGNGLGLELAMGSSANDPTWEDNLVFGNVMDYTEDPDPAGAFGNLSVDPELMDPEGGDYHLASGSPALDVGSEAGMPEEDFEGTPRPIDGDGDGVAGVDIGAFEFVPSETAPEIVIDVRPGMDFNFVNPWGLGALPVAVLGSPEVDVRQVDPATLRFGPGLAPLAHADGPHYLDVNGDGFEDLLAHFRGRFTGIARGDREACMSGEYAGSPFLACDQVSVLGFGRPIVFRQWFLESLLPPPS